MIYLGNVFEIDITEYDEVWVICRSVREIDDLIRNHDNVFHVPELSPSQELFSWYRNQVHKDQWGIEAFRNYYVPVFLQMLREDSEGYGMLRKLVVESIYKDIALVCFCSDEKLCHRSIVGGVLLKMGANIECDEEYRIYGEPE